MAFPLDTRLLYRFSVNQGDFKKVSEEISRLRRALLSIGFPPGSSRRALICAYELAMNIVIHAYEGLVEARWQGGNVEIIAEDSGPGIADIELAMKEGYSTAPAHVREMGFGAGMGLPNVKKASDKFDLVSEVGRGTKASAVVRPVENQPTASGGFHSVRLDPSKCKGCTNCIKGCPTEAIRVRNGKAFILEDRCIDCGECVRRCPNKAKYVVSDSLSVVKRYDYPIALVAPSFYGQFDEHPAMVKQALKVACGFSDVFDVSVAADLVSRLVRHSLDAGLVPRPAISSACPAILRLIQVRYPSLLRNLVSCEAPMEIAAWLAKRLATERGVIRPSCIFVSPCPAKITAVRQPVGRGSSNVDAAVAMQDVVKVVHRALRDVKGEMPYPESTALGIGWGFAGGEALSVGRRAISVDGIAGASSVLEEIENGGFQDVDFVEAQACSGGCVGGCLAVRNPYVARVRLKDLVAKYKDAPEHPAVSYVSPGEPGLWFSIPITPRPVFRLHADPNEAEAKLKQLRDIEKRLPGLDCGACGAPTCRALAEDIVLGRGTVWDCTFKLRERLESLALEVKELAGRRPPAMGLQGDVPEEDRTDGSKGTGS